MIIIFKGAEINLTDVSYTPGCPARIRWDENDHPEEGAEIEFRINTGHDDFNDFLENFWDELEELAIQACEDDAVNAKEEAMVSRYESRMEDKAMGWR